MKRILALLLICGLGLAACGESAASDAPPAQLEETELPETVSAMAAPIHALAETMLYTGEDYQPQDSEFFWNSLHFFLETYGNRHGAVGLSEEGTMRVPRKTMQEHAIALFSDYSDLLELPESLSDRIVYDDDWDAYLIYPTDYVPYTLSLSDLAEEDGKYHMEASLSDAAGDKVGTWEVTLVKNTYADGIENPLYPYSVSSMQSIGTQTEHVVFNGLTDAHTVEVTLSDGTVAAFQFDADSEAGETLQNLDIGESFTMRYHSDEGTGISKIVGAE